MQSEHLAGLIEHIDAAALDDAAWPGVLTRIADTFGAYNASMTIQAGERAEAIGVRLDPNAAGQFIQHYAARNPLPRYSEIDEAFGRRAVVVRPHVKEVLVRSDYYNDFLKPFGMAHLAWVFLDRRGSAVSLMNIGRPEHLEPFDTATLELFTELMPHLMRSYRIGCRLGGFLAKGRMLEQYLEQLPEGVVLLDAVGRIIHANRAAQVIAGARDGLRFGPEGLLTALPDAQDRVRAAVALAANRHLHPRHARVLSLPRPSGARPYVVAICPFGDDAAPPLFDRPSVLVEVRDPDAEDRLSEQWFAEYLNLTTAEARVGALMLAGTSRDEIAGRLGVSSNTVRVHIARIMAKTDTHRQAELVGFLGKIASLQRGVARYS